MSLPEQEQTAMPSWHSHSRWAPTSSDPDGTEPLPDPSAAVPPDAPPSREVAGGPEPEAEAELEVDGGPEAEAAPELEVGGRPAVEVERAAAAGPAGPEGPAGRPQRGSIFSRARAVIAARADPSSPVADHERTRNVIVVDRVAKTYVLGDIAVHALQGVSLTIGRGDFVAIMGASGSGKSTLMNIIGCLDLPSRGRYLLDGVDVRGMTEDELSDVRNRKIGFVFQSFNLIPRTPAIVNVELPLTYAGLKKADRRRRAERALVEVGLAERLHHLPSELSGGQQQRVAVARAIATNPAIILADEPTGNLDTKATGEVLEIFDRLNAGGRTVVMITHEDDVSAHAKRVIRLVDGHVVDDHRQAPALGPPPRYHARNRAERARHEAERPTT